MPPNTHSHLHTRTQTLITQKVNKNNKAKGEYGGERTTTLET